MIRPEQAQAAAKKNLEPIVTALETRIDAAITARFDGKRVSVDMLTDATSVHTLTAPVRQEIERRYRAGGWAVHWEQGSDQREGNWCYLVLSPAPLPRSFGSDMKD